MRWKNIGFLIVGALMQGLQRSSAKEDRRDSRRHVLLDTETTCVSRLSRSASSFGRWAAATGPNFHCKTGNYVSIDGDEYFLKIALKEKDMLHSLAERVEAGFLLVVPRVICVAPRRSNKQACSFSCASAEFVEVLLCQARARVKPSAYEKAKVVCPTEHKVGEEQIWSHYSP